MARGKSRKRLTDSEESSSTAAAAEAFPSELLAASPVMLLVFFHQAFRGELSELHLLAAELVEGGRPDLVAVIRDRFEFLKLAYSYHSAAEDEVIFLALHKNVASRYSLEHRSIDELFDSFFQTIDALLMDGESNPEACRELLFSIGTIQALICKHMLKEEKQVFPMLMQQFSQEEQASLMWQFMCSVPIMLLEDFLPWIVSFLSQEEREHIVSCVKDIVPQEEPLQEVIRIWLYKKYQPSSNVKRIQMLLPSSTKNLGEITENSAFDLSKSPLDGFTLWHAAIREDLAATLQELYLIRSSMCFSSLNSVVIQLKFLADVLSFYSNALDQLFYPLLTEFGDEGQSINEFPGRSHIKSLQELLHDKNDSNMPQYNAINQLCHELELRVAGIDEFLTFNETKVFDRIKKNCNLETQQQLVCLSIRMLPLGLLKCAMTWFLANLCETQLLSIISVAKDAKAKLDSSSSVDNPFAALLYEWFRVASNRKTSSDKFRRDLQEIFKGRIYFLSNLETTDDQVKSPCCSSNLEMPYSSGINQHVFFPSTPRPTETTNPFTGSISNSVLESSHQSRPMDIIVYFHKALKKDLERLVEDALHLTENVGFLKDFRRHFDLMKLLYKLHSDSEDDIAFPALEAKEQRVQNISHSYTIDHKLEVQLFDDISALLDKMMNLQANSLISTSTGHRQLGIELQNMSRTMQKLLSDHIDQEDIEIWSLFGECFTVEEQDRIIGSMLGRIRAEILQDMIPWLMASLSVEEYQAMMSSWRKIARNTMFDEWLSEWWEEHDNDVNMMEKSSCRNVLRIPERNQDPMEIISSYLSRDILNEHEGHTVNCHGHHNHDNTNAEDEHGKKLLTEGEEKSGAGKCCELGGTSEELEAAIRRVSRDSSLDSRKKSFIIQNLLMSRWIIAQQKSAPINEEEIPGRSPSYRDPLKHAFGCKHYKRNCKLLAECCNKLHTCRRCHEDEITEHNLDRKSITQMMCMNCLVIQSIGPVCKTKSCNNRSMGKYYCRICKIFDDEREIYHCPYCNLCRVGKGLGIDYFHCMNCNACMSVSLIDHICREKCFEDNCPICHEYIFTSSSPVKALMCGHLMHSACFQEYTCTHYTCPICSKSLGDMQVYFQMLDSLLAEERMPEEYLGQTQIILCNDCGKRGNSPFHWLYHKCSHCSSYNTRLL